MQRPAQITFGTLTVQYLGDHWFAFRDAHDPTQVEMLEDRDVPELIRFLYHWSSAAKEAFRPHDNPPSPPKSQST